MTHQEQKACPQSKGPQITPKPPYYPDPDEDNPDGPEDDLEASGTEPSEPGGSTDEVEEGDRIFIMTYTPPKAISTTSTTSQQIMEESAKDNPRQEKSLHDMVPPRFWGHMDAEQDKFLEENLASG